MGDATRFVKHELGSVPFEDPSVFAPHALLESVYHPGSASWSRNPRGMSFELPAGFVLLPHQGFVVVQVPAACLEIGAHPDTPSLCFIAHHRLIVI